jgi:hypothetical protein
MVIYNIIAKRVVKAYIYDTIGRIHVRPKQLYQGRSSAQANAEPNHEAFPTLIYHSRRAETTRVSVVTKIELIAGPARNTGAGFVYGTNRRLCE